MNPINLDDKQEAFIQHLLGLAQEGQEDRAALAELRRDLGKEPGKMAHVHRHVVEYVAQDDETQDWCYVIATLFGVFPQHRSKYSLGAAFRPLRSKSDSMEARFVALLNAHPDDLYMYLRHAVRLLEAHKEPFDWRRLLYDVLHWNEPESDAQLEWARDFYKP